MEPKGLRLLELELDKSRVALSTRDASWVTDLCINGEHAATTSMLQKTPKILENTFKNPSSNTLQKWCLKIALNNRAKILVVSPAEENQMRILGWMLMCQLSLISKWVNNLLSQFPAEAMFILGVWMIKGSSVLAMTIPSVSQSRFHISVQPKSIRFSQQPRLLVGSSTV